MADRLLLILTYAKIQIKILMFGEQVEFELLKDFCGTKN